MAFHPNFVDKYLKFEKVFKYNVGDKNGNPVAHFTSVGHLNHSTMVWESPGSEEIQKYFPGAKLATP